jgi:hypothetical protein
LKFVEKALLAVAEVVRDAGMDWQDGVLVVGVRRFDLARSGRQV